MRILITGGAGYMGTALASLLLEQGHEVRVLDALNFGCRQLMGIWSNSKFELVHGDIRDNEVVSTALDGIDAVVHLAAIVGDPACARDPDLTKAVNLEASRSIISLCGDMGVERLIFASTCSNYGRMADPTQYIDEHAELQPLSLYAETKVAIERDLIAAGESSKFTFTLLRFATLFGISPRMRFDLTVNEFAMELATTGELKVYGEQFWRPYVHVRDAGRAIASVLESDADLVAGEVFNVGATSQNFRKQDIVDMISAKVEKVNIEYVRKEEDPRDYRVSFDKIASKIGFDITLTVEDGIDEILKLVGTSGMGDLNDPIFRN
jgi:nucleoside-diphosphate-sugar epimerase